MVYSIVVPVYNVEMYVEKCIKSVLEQTYKQLELILVDDGSTDQSKRICEAEMEKDHRIKVISQKNNGASAARNKGIEAATGDYILFLDGDDFWLRDDVLEQINQRLESRKSDVLVYNYAKILNGEVQKPYFFESDVPVDCNEEASFQYIYDNDLWTSSAWNKAISRKMLKNADLTFIEGITAEDIEWCAKIIKQADSVDYINVVAVGYVQRKGSVTSTITKKKLYSLEKSVTEVVNTLNGTVEIKNKILKRFLAFQVAVLLINIAGIDYDNRREFLEDKDIKSLLLYLKYAKNEKVRFLGKIACVLPARVLIEAVAVGRKIGTMK